MRDDQLAAVEKLAELRALLIELYEGVFECPDGLEREAVLIDRANAIRDLKTKISTQEQLVDRIKCRDL